MVSSLSSVRDLLPSARFIGGRVGASVETRADIQVGQPVIVTYPNGLVQVEHIGGPSHTTLSGVTITDLTYFREDDAVYDPACGVCGKDGMVEYFGDSVEYACWMCHMWMIQSGIADKHPEFACFAVVVTDLEDVGEFVAVMATPAGMENTVDRTFLNS